MGKVKTTKERAASRGASYRRVVVIVLDSVGIGELPDAADFGDAGTSTLEHVAAAVGGLRLPALEALGLGDIATLDGVSENDAPTAFFGKMGERSAGKDTTTGHWELMGLPLAEPFAVFPDGFPPEVIESFRREASVEAILGNVAASGTEILDALGDRHVRTGHPIVYTSADSVFQIAGHADVIPLERLYEMCRVARRLLDRHRVGRVIARPFIGTDGSYERTYDRKDLSMAPSGSTALDRVAAAGLPVVGVGKISDIFAGRGVTRSEPTRGNADGIETTARMLDEVPEGFIFVNLIDFDSEYGHRRDPRGYAACLEAFDAGLPAITDRLRAGDLAIITADHGNDPTYTATTDHTREYVPLLVLDPMRAPADRRAADLGVRSTFADVGATVCAALGVTGTGAGDSVLAHLDETTLRPPTATETL